MMMSPALALEVNMASNISLQKKTCLGQSSEYLHVGIRTLAKG
jgi:hypothetical protein